MKTQFHKDAPLLCGGELHSTSKLLKCQFLVDKENSGLLNFHQTRLIFEKQQPSS